MQARIDTITDGDGNYVYPRTKEEAIMDGNGVGLDNKLDAIAESLSKVLDNVTIRYNSDTDYIQCLVDGEYKDLMTAGFKSLKLDLLNTTNSNWTNTNVTVVVNTWYYVIIVPLTEVHILYIWWCQMQHI